jgi:transcriptional regulator with XRE-family HTH domain
MISAVLRDWRQRRRLSQLEFAARARISQRHLSFLEIGRAAPSRDMVIRPPTAVS